MLIDQRREQPSAGTADDAHAGCPLQPRSGIGADAGDATLFDDHVAALVELARRIDGSDVGENDNSVHGRRVIAR